MSNPDVLGSEELLYAASLQAADSDKFKVYQSYARRFPEDHRGFNNMGVIYVQMGKINEAQGEFEKASKVAPSKTAIQNNLGVIAAMKGDKMNAAKFFAAAGSGSEVTYNKANLDIANGNYASAVSGFGETCSFNAALAKVLNGNASGANQTLDCSIDKDSAEGFYLRAVIAARSGDAKAIATNLTKAIAAKSEMKSKAKSDMEFEKYAAELSGILN